VGQPVTLPPTYQIPFLSVTDPQGREQTLGADRERLFSETFQPGLYRLRGQLLNGLVWEGGFGVNAGSASESDLRVSAQPVLNALAQAGAPPPLPGNPPLELWPWFVLAVLAIMVVEAWLAWR